MGEGPRAIASHRPFAPELPGHELFENLPILESLLKPYPRIRLVLSTSWVRSLDFDRAKSYLTPSLQQRVIGATYHRHHMRKSEFEELPRHAQILQDVERRRPQQWLAVDDEFGEGVPTTVWAHFVQTPTELGLACPQAAGELKHRLAALFSGQSATCIDDIKHDHALR